MDYSTQLITRLYRSMPGAPQPPHDERGPLWGEVEGNEHWSFCAEIVGMIQSEIGTLAAEHNLI